MLVIALGIAAVSELIEGKAAEVTVLYAGYGTLIAGTWWMISLYELKMEYVFPGLSVLSGHVLSTDRAIKVAAGLVYMWPLSLETTNLSIFQSIWIPFGAGAISCLAGTALVYIIPKKRLYLRQIFEMELDPGGDVDGLRRNSAQFRSARDEWQMIAFERL